MGFSPAGKVSMDERDSNHDGRRHKKDVHPVKEIHYNTSRHEPNASRRGASEGCRPKLPRWPFSAPAAPKLRVLPVHGSMVRNLGAESSFFVQRLTFFCAPRAARFVVTFLPPASFLAPTPPRPSLIAPAVFCVLSASSGHRVNTWRERSTG